MGDRANVFVKGDGRDDSGVYLYTHWSGTELPAVLQTALAKRWRWDDGQYLTRIIFCEMVDGSEHDETGYGISTYCVDGRRRVLTVNPDKQTVSFGSKTWTFEQYIALSADEIADVWSEV